MLAALLSGFCMQACVVNEATGKRQLDIYSKAAEVQLGEQVATEIEASIGPVVTDPGISGYVTDVGNRVAAHVEPYYQDIPWEFNVVDDATINAFALPGGKIYIHRGLLEILDNEAQLAGILAHEIAHVTAEHHDRMAGRGIAIALGTSIVQILQQNTENELVQLGVPVFVTSSGLLNLKYSRDQEYESDELGLRYMIRAGYQPTVLAEVMRKLDEISAGQRPSEWFSTHPHPPNRVNAIMESIQRDYPDAADDPQLRLNQDAYKRNILDAF